MEFTTETVSDGVSERLFTLGEITGVLWAPAATPAAEGAGRPVILLGHGGGQHKLGPGLVARARRFVTRLGAVAVAIDAPEHGDRPTAGARARFTAEAAELRAAGEPVLPAIVRYNLEMAAHAVPEWQATLDAVQQLPETGPAGYWGVSMGTMIGLPLVAAEPRIGAAVLGLAGGPALEELAARVTIPVEFLLQWDDELVARESVLALFGAFGSAEKTLHANAGQHGAIPRFELDSAERFFARHLTGS